MNINNLQSQNILQKIKDNIEGYKIEEAELYLSLVKSKFSIHPNIFNYLSAKLYILKNDITSALNILTQVKEGIFYDESRYLLSKLYLMNNNFDYGDSLFISRLKRGEKQTRYLYNKIDTDLPLWSFEKNCKVKIWQDFAIGETVLLLRLINILKSHSTVNFTIYLDPRLLSLFEHNFPSFNFVDLSVQTDLSLYDYHLPIGSMIKLIDNSNIEKIKEIPILKLTKNINQEKNLISIFIASENIKDSIHKTINNDHLLKLLTPLKQDYKFQIINYGKSKQNLENFLNEHKFKVKPIEKDLYNNFENLSEVFLNSSMSIMTSCSEAYISAALGLKTIILFNQTFTSNWMWHQNDSNFKNIWFQDLYCYPFKKIKKQITFDYFPDLEKIIEIK